MEKLVKKRTHPEESPLYYVTVEDTFDVIKRAHIATGHGGRDRMIKELQRKYANIIINKKITRCIVCLFPLRDFMKSLTTFFRDFTKLLEFSGIS